MFQSKKVGSSGEAGSRFASPLDEAKHLFSQARVELENLAGAGAIAKIRRAVTLVDGAQSCPVELRVCLRADGAKLLSRFGHPAHAEPLLAEGVQLLVSSGDPMYSTEIARFQIRRGELLYEQDRLSESETCLQAAIGLLSHRSPRAIRAKLDLGLVALKQGAAEGMLSRYGAIMSEVFSDCARAPAAERSGISTTLTKSAEAFTRHGYFSEAVLIAQEALSVYRESPECSQDACRMLRLLIAEIAHKAGRFDQALSLRQALLQEVRADERFEKNSKLELEIAQSLGETLIELRRFEQAEILLRDTFEAARRADDAERALECSQVLMNQYVVRHMEEEVVALREATEDLSPKIGPMYALLKKVDEEIAFNDDADAALPMIDELLDEARKLTGAERVLGETAILASKAMAIAAVSPEEANALVMDVVSRLESIPAPFDEGIRGRLAVAQARLAIVQSDPHTAVRVLSRQLAELERSEGRGRHFVRVKIMIQLAEALEAAGENDRALGLARQLVGMFEEQKDVHSLLFAEALLLLSGLLPTGSPEHEAAIERAVPIIQRHRKG